jgi:hypothetical protein
MTEKLSSDSVNRLRCTLEQYGDNVVLGGAKVLNRLRDVL